MTYVEILVVLGIMSIVFAIGLPLSLNQIYRTSVEAEARKLSSTIFSLQQKANSGSQNSNHGIKLATNKYTIYRGTSFAAGLDKFETLLDTKNTITTMNLINSSDEITFTKGTFRPNSWGTILLTNSTDSYIVEINMQGFITYYKQ